ncbi:glycosyltransferase [uncultured Microbacterium sp.]|uniref:glycosyltransferase n=1 Tax=uncultured Microbacterium sp. TaxID=191216 RepID=UPI0025F31DBF|nr:glycosyltransferase [uncultured Microbacterium sp.]
MTASHVPPTPRRRVLIGAYACGPVEESEAAAGWALATAAASLHDVTVITRTRFRDAVTPALAADAELAARMTVVYVDPPRWIMRLRQKLPGALYWFYPLWQGNLLREARRLHASNPFQVAHHVTFANDWLRCGLAALPKVPFVWGPVGGASKVPYLRLAQWLGVRGALTEAARDALTALPRAVWGGQAARRAGVVVAQNPDVARRFRRARNVVVEPNAAIERTALPKRQPVDPERPLAVFAGRLLAWKGARLALTTIAQPQVSDWHLDVYGEGYELNALRRLATELGVADRVRFLGRVPRQEVLRAFARADALLFPSMHDQAGWVAAEASTLGLPVVCLALGGPATLAGRNAFVAASEGDIPANLARQLVSARATGGVPHDRWSSDRLPALVTQWYETAIRAEEER